LGFTGNMNLYPLWRSWITYLYTGDYKQQMIVIKLTFDCVSFLATCAFCRSFSRSDSSCKVSCRKNLSSTVLGIEISPSWKYFTWIKTCKFNQQHLL
jgi:hypothetical protein